MSSAAITAHLAARQGVSIRVLIWLGTTSRADGSAQPMGLWGGAEDVQLDVEGVTRTYYGAGAVVDVSPIRSRAGLSVQMQRIVLSGVAPEVAIAVREREARMASVEIHVLHLVPLTGAQIGIERVFKGQVDKAVIEQAEIGGEATVNIVAASAARYLTRPLTALRSDANQRRRQNDGIFKYASVGLVKVWWGQDRP